jgi:hypothetical protein
MLLASNVALTTSSRRDGTLTIFAGAPENAGSIHKLPRPNLSIFC